MKLEKSPYTRYESNNFAFKKIVQNEKVKAHDKGMLEIIYCSGFLIASSSAEVYYFEATY